MTVIWVVAVISAAIVGFALGRRSGDPTGTGSTVTSEPATITPVSDVQATTPDGDLLNLLVQALDRIDQGVVVCDEQSHELFRNRVASSYLEARDALVLVEAALQEELAGALTCHGPQREVDLFGPPSQTFVIRARPFLDGSGAFAVVEDQSIERRTETVRRDFVANISHELKTPIGALGLLADTIRGETDPSVIDRLSARMVSEAHRVSDTIDDLLELSRIEFGDDAEPAVLTASEVVAEAVGRISAAAENAGVRLDPQVESGLTLRGDRRQFVSALFNLIDNAVKYSSAGDEVRIIARSAADRTELVVSDDGVGIPRRDLDRIFERFYRVDRARSRGTGGTGLGLAIVRHIATNHGGDVSVESTEGLGTTFTIWVPSR